MSPTDPPTARHGELLAERLMRSARLAVQETIQDGWIEDAAKRAAMLIDAALEASRLANFDPRILQMELAGYFTGGRCEFGYCGERFIRESAGADLFGATFVDQLSEAARLDGLGHAFEM